MNIRPARTADAAAIADIHVRCWRRAYRGLMPDSVLDALDVGERTARWERNLTQSAAATLVAETDSGRIVGWMSSGESRDPDTEPGTIELWALYVDPDRWSDGVGRALMARLEEDLPPRTPLTLWVLRDNSRARRFYESVGFAAEPDATSDYEVAPGSLLPKVRLRRPVTTAPPGP